MWIAVTVPVLIVVYFVLIRKRKVRKNKLLDFKIGTTDGFYYNVEFENLAAGINPGTERIHALLGFITQIIEHTDKNFLSEKNDILKFLSEVTRADLSKKKINEYFKREFAFELSTKEQMAEGKVMSGALYRVNPKKRKFELNTPPSWFKYQFLFSVGSFINFSLKRMDITQHEDLRKSLQFIANAHLNKIANRNSKNPFTNLENDAYKAGFEKTTVPKASAI